MTRLAFLSDAHVNDYRSKVDAATGLNAGFVDSLNVLRWVAGNAEERSCEALVFAGDMTEERSPAPWRVALIKEALAEFLGPIHLLRGNHDSLRHQRSIVDVLAEERRGWHGYSRPGVAVVDDTAIAFVPWIDRSWLRAQPGFESVPDADVYRTLAEQYVLIARALYVEASQAAERTILVTHATLSGGRMSESQQVFLGDLALVVDTAALSAIGYDAILAGHLHEHQVLSTAPLIAYIGSPHYVDFGETAAKGYLVIDTEQLPAFEFVPTPARRFTTLLWRDDAADLEGQFVLMAPAIRDAVVRVMNAPGDADVASIRRHLEQLGAFEVAGVSARPREAATPSGSFAEGQTPADALAAYFAGDDDAEALVDHGKTVLAEVTA